MTVCCRRNAFHHTVLPRKLCTPIILEKHRHHDPEIYGDPAKSLNLVPRRDVEGYRYLWNDWHSAAKRQSTEPFLSHLSKRIRFRGARE